MASTPCDWPLLYVDGDCGPQDGETTEETATRERFERMATELLWRWTGRRFGVCEVVTRPCRSDCTPGGSTFFGGPATTALPTGGGTWTPALIGGRWYNMTCGTCGPSCDCSPSGPKSLRLPGQPREIVSVTVDGETLAPSAYMLAPTGHLLRLDGQRWPKCQDMTAPATEPDTFEIVYTSGEPVPEGGQIAAAALACQLRLAAEGDKSCELPQRVQSITRQGVSVAVLDAFEDLAEGRTGIWTIDAWVSSVKTAHTPVPAVRTPQTRKGGATWRRS